MTRTVKFQFWEIARKRMLQWEEVLSEETCGVSVFFDQPERYIPREFIGRKDTHGTDIYEGDILRGEGGGTCVVEWEEDITCCRWWMTANGFGISFDDDSEATGKVEIIGNIYETPNLIPEDKTRPPSA